jgi:hypothetical protein
MVVEATSMHVVDKNLTSLPPTIDCIHKKHMDKIKTTHLKLKLGNL